MLDELDVEGFSLSDVVERLVVETDFKSEGCIIGLLSVCTPLETVFCSYGSIFNLSLRFYTSPCFGECEIVGVFKANDFCFLVKSRTFFGG